MCYYCKKSGHLQRDCLKKKKDSHKRRTTTAPARDTKKLDNRLHVSLHVGRSEQVALIDMGAARSLVSLVWKEYCEQKKIPMCVKADVTLQSVNGIRIPLQGRGEIEIEGSKITVYISSVVDGIILGDDALRQPNAQINVKENFVILKGKKFPHIQKVNGVGEIMIPEPVMKFSKLTNKA